MTPQEFDAVYWAAQPKEIRALRDIKEEFDREGRAVDLAVKGFIVDRHIHVWLVQPYWTMRWRADQGLTWVPSLLQQSLTWAPGDDTPTGRYDPKNPPMGSIKVSLDPKDYPPWDPPAPPAPVVTPAPHVPTVGGYLYSHPVYGKIFAALDPNDPHIDGDIVDDPRGKFVCHVTGRVGTFAYQRFYTPA